MKFSWLSCRFIAIQIFVVGVLGKIEYEPTSYRYRAIIEWRYKDKNAGIDRIKQFDQGEFGGHIFDRASGFVYHVKTIEKKHDGCTEIIDPPIRENWIALIERGGCNFAKKIQNAIAKNASAVVVYNNSETNTVIMDHEENIVSVFIQREHGLEIAELLKNKTKVFMTITRGKKEPRVVMRGPTPMNTTSILFVSISFVVLMLISLAWLFFYYIQRFRYAHVKQRKTTRLRKAAKKAISKMPTKTLKADDKEVQSGFDQCAVCLEDYKVNDVVRIVPCQHIFHKSCVDMWLIEHRSCPMCKLDILKAMGMQLEQSEGNVARMDVERRSPSDDWLHGFDLALDSFGSQEHHIQMVQIDTTDQSRPPPPPPIPATDAASSSSDDVSNVAACVRVSADLHREEQCHATPSSVGDFSQRQTGQPEEEALLQKSGDAATKTKTESERGNSEESVSLLGIAYTHRDHV